MYIKQGDYVFAAGYVPRDAEVRTTQTGKDVCNFSIKATERTDENGQKSVVWMNCVAWRKACDVARYFVKGDIVFCAGELKTRSYTSREGEPRTATELDCEFVSSMSMPAMAPMFPDILPQQQSTTAAPTLPDFEEVVSDDDLPF